MTRSPAVIGTSSKSAICAPLDRWADDAGFHRSDGLRAELLRAHIFPESMRRPAATLADFITECESGTPPE